MLDVICERVYKLLESEGQRNFVPCSKAWFLIPIPYLALRPRFLIPYVCFSGKVRYKFASFWNRNHTYRALQKAVKNYHAMLEAEKQVLFMLGSLQKCQNLYEISKKSFVFNISEEVYPL